MILHAISINKSSSRDLIQFLKTLFSNPIEKVLEDTVHTTKLAYWKVKNAVCHPPATYVA